jgi:hypothetical protein
LPLDEAPVPDCFNGMFIKKCWSILKLDFYALFEAFYHGQIDLKCLNNSYITLVPKVHSPHCVNDYRPISLLGGPVEINHQTSGK